MVRHQDFVACLYIEGQLPPVEPFQTNLTNLHAYTTIPFPLQPGTRLRLGWEDHRGGPGQGGLQVFAECGWEPEGAQRQLTRVGPRREDNGQARMSQEWVVGEGSQRGIISLAIFGAIKNHQGVVVPGPELVGFYWKVTPPLTAARAGPGSNGSPVASHQSRGAPSAAPLGYYLPQFDPQTSHHPLTVSTVLRHPNSSSGTGSALSHPSLAHSSSEPAPKRRHTINTSFTNPPSPHILSAPNGSPAQHTPRIVQDTVGFTQHGAPQHGPPSAGPGGVAHATGVLHGSPQAGGMVGAQHGWGVHQAGPAIELRLAQLQSENEKLRAEWDKEKENSKFYEQSVAKLYARLTHARLIGYLSERLRAEDLSPTMRVSVAVAKSEAITRLRKERDEKSTETFGWVVELLEVGLQGH